MAIYVMSDIHGEYDKFMEILEKIKLKNTDTLYILGDILDRGLHPIKVLLKIMEMSNVMCMAGNHELMALECLEFLQREITELSLEELDVHTLDNLITWQYNGGDTTIEELLKLSWKMQHEVIGFLREMSVYEKLTVARQKYLLVHAGLGNYSPKKKMRDYSLEEIVWLRADYSTKYFDDVYVISGHTPTQTIKENLMPGYIYRANNHIAIDCGAYFDKGRLAALCLDTGEEFYSSC